MKPFKNKKGSILVERILMVAFAVAAGSAVILYGSQTITNAKNTQITGILGNGSQEGMTQEQLDAHFNDSAKTITITANELNSKTFPNLSALPNNSALWQTTISFGGSTFILDDMSKLNGQDLALSYINGEDWYEESINFNWGPGDFEYGCKKFCYFSGGAYGNYEDFNYPFEWHLGSLYETFKAAILADLG